MKKSFVSLMAGSVIGLISMSVYADTTTYRVKGSQSASANSCVPFLGLFLGISCSSNQDGETEIFGAPDGLAATGWAGPFYSGGFYKQGTAPGVADPGGLIPGGKKAPSLNGKITIDDQGDADPTNDVIGGRVTVGKTTHAYLIGNPGIYGEASWNKLEYTITPKMADSATPNANGGVDYVIGSRGMPQTLVEIGLPDADGDNFAEPGGPGSPAPTEIGGTFGQGFYQEPGVFNFNPTALNDTPGIASYESSGPVCSPAPCNTNIGTTATGEFKDFSCVDIASSGACANALSIGNDPDIDNLTMFISTDGAGNILRGYAFAAREFDTAGCQAGSFPGCLFVPDGVPDSMSYTTWSFTYTK